VARPGTLGTPSGVPPGTRRRTRTMTRIATTRPGEMIHFGANLRRVLEEQAPRRSPPDPLHLQAPGYGLTPRRSPVFTTVDKQLPSRTDPPESREKSKHPGTLTPRCEWRAFRLSTSVRQGVQRGQMRRCSWSGRRWASQGRGEEKEVQTLVRPGLTTPGQLFPAPAGDTM
jgi:hypothetical protein